MPSKLEQLEQQQAKLKKQIHAEKAKQRQQQRKDDTRRKVLLGAYVQVKMEESANYKAELLSGLATYLTRPSDRQLFDLEPLPEETASKETAEAEAAQERDALTPPPLPQTEQAIPLTDNQE